MYTKSIENIPEWGVVNKLKLKWFDDSKGAFLVTILNLFNLEVDYEKAFKEEEDTSKLTKIVRLMK